MIARILLALLSAIPVLNISNSAGQINTLELAVPEPRNNELFPESKDYVAVLQNNGEHPITIKAVQRAGGFAGSGRLYQCSLQLWNPFKKVWVTKHFKRRADLDLQKHLVEVALQPGEKLRVCHSLLPQQQGHKGDFARFALSVEWDKPPTIFSKRFTIR